MWKINYTGLLLLKHSACSPDRDKYVVERWNNTTDSFQIFTPPMEGAAGINISSRKYSHIDYHQKNLII